MKTDSVRSFRDNSLGAWIVRASYLAAAMFLLVAPYQVRGQLLQGNINGNVTDTSQSAIPGATVRAVNKESNFARETTTGAGGEYTLTTMPPGTYTVTVTSNGFQTFNLTGVTVAAETITRVDVALKLGEVKESVTVEATAAVLQTDRADVRSEIPTTVLAAMPVPMGRNYQNLLGTLPGVSPPQTAHSFASNSSRALTFSVNGGSINNNDIRVDGAMNWNVAATDNALYVPALEAIESVSLASNSFDAEQSAGGGAVNLTVKSGTNAIHGTVYEDHINQHLMAYPWTADRTKPNPLYLNNQFGGAIGGPIKKDKLFYFISSDSVRYVQTTPVAAEVPTAAMKLGDLSASPTPIYNPFTGNANGTGRTPFTGNIIPVGMIDKGVQALLNTGAWPNPNQAGTGAFGLGRNYIASGNGGQNRDQWDAKLNWNATSKLSMFVRFGMNQSTWTTGQLFGLLGGPTLSSANTAAGIGGAHVYSGTISGTYVFTAHVVADAHFGYTRINSFSQQPNQDQNLGSTLLQVPGLSTANETPYQQRNEGGMPTLNIDNFGVLGSPNNFQPQSYNDPNRNFDGNLSWIKGTHEIRGGFESDYIATNEMQYQQTGAPFDSGAGGFHFATGTTALNGGPAGNDFNSFAAFLLGLPQDSGKVYQFPEYMYTRTKTYGIYLRDKWQITPKLTVTFGGREEFYPFPVRAGTGTEIWNFTTNQILICGVASTPTDCGVSSHKQRFVPRAGLAYRVGGSMVIRAGYAQVTDPTITARRLGPPYELSELLLPPNSFSYATTLRQGIPTPATPDLTKGAVPWPNNATVATEDANNYVRGYIQTWNLTIEEQFKGWLTSVGYVASRNVDGRALLEQNWSPIGTGTAGQQLNVLSGRTASTTLTATEGTNKYDSLQARLQHRFDAGVQLNMAYTFGKAVGFVNTENSNQQNGPPVVAIPAYYRIKNYGYLPFDIKHNFQTTLLVELPFGKGKPWLQSGIGAAILGGWRMSGVVSAYSGRPFTPTAAASSLNATFSGQFADCISAPDQTGNIFGWYNKSAFAVPANGRFGTCGSGILRGPGVINSDLSLERTINITERINLKFRAEMFNVANNPHHDIPPAANNSVNSSTFLQTTNIVNTGREGIDQRSMRLGLQLRF